MKVAVLPFNTTEGTSPALGRQFANFPCDIARANTGGDINAVSYLTDIQEDGELRSVFANASTTLSERVWVEQMFEKTTVDLVVDGLLKVEGDKFELTVRFHAKDVAEPIQVETWQFGYDGLFEHLTKLIQLFVEKTGLPSRHPLDAKIGFGTEDPEAFVKFLEGYDGLLYIEQAMGRVTRNFASQSVIDLLMGAVRLDPEFVAPADTLVQFCRSCANWRLAPFEVLVSTLDELSRLVPSDFKPVFALGELFAAAARHEEAAGFFERAIELEGGEGWLYAKLAMSQMALGMPANAERNLRKAIELEGPEKASTDLLANLLLQTGRGHEVPALWKAIVDADDQNAAARGKYAISLIQTGQVEQGVREFEEALEDLDGNLIIKRFYAPYLANENDIDRAMDFYEDCLDHAPNDIDTLKEYAQTLQKAGREFEVPRVLQTILESNPDPDTKAETFAWLIELEQPKRAQNVREAQEKLNEGNFEMAAKELKPMRNWLADYWKLWLYLAAAQNGLKAYEEAEESARRLVQFYPGCEPAYGQLATALYGQGKHEQAYETLSHAASMLPESLEIHVNLALAAKRAGRSDEARSLARQIREVVGPNEELEPFLVEIEA